MEAPSKPLGRKAYGSIAHLPGSRLGPGDHHAHEGQVRIATERLRDRHDKVIVQEKMDGSCTAVAKVGGEVIPLGRAGYRAITSPYRQHTLFHGWVMEHWEAFDRLLDEGERVVGEWLAQAHSTMYDLTSRDPWLAFDIIKGGQGEKGVPRAPEFEMSDRVSEVGLTPVPHIMSGGPVTIAEAMALIGEHGRYGADRAEGAVWRVERKGVVDFVVKYVRPDKVDGLYLPGTSDATVDAEVWNWQP